MVDENDDCDCGYIDAGQPAEYARAVLAGVDAGVNGGAGTGPAAAARFDSSTAHRPAKPEVVVEPVRGHDGATCDRSTPVVPSGLLAALRGLIGDDVLTEHGAIHYLREALDHRSRCSAWLAELDIWIGFTAHLTQDDGEPGRQAQASRIAALERLRANEWSRTRGAPPTAPTTIQGRARTSWPWVVLLSPSEDRVLDIQLPSVPRAGEILAIGNEHTGVPWRVERVAWQIRTSPDALDRIIVWTSEP
jgi:hypothetical protein